jgi:hypothetical protein
VERWEGGDAGAGPRSCESGDPTDPALAGPLAPRLASGDAWAGRCPGRGSGDCSGEVPGGVTVAERGWEPGGPCGAAGSGGGGGGAPGAGKSHCHLPLCRPPGRDQGEGVHAR